MPNANQDDADQNTDQNSNLSPDIEAIISKIPSTTDNDPIIIDAQDSQDGEILDSDAAHDDGDEWYPARAPRKRRYKEKSSQDSEKDAPRTESLTVIFVPTKEVKAYEGLAGPTVEGVIKNVDAALPETKIAGRLQSDTEIARVPYGSAFAEASFQAMFFLGESGIQCWNSTTDRLNATGVEASDTTLSRASVPLLAAAASRPHVPQTAGGPEESPAGARRTSDPADWMRHRQLDAAFRRHTSRLQRQQWDQLCSSFGSAASRSIGSQLQRALDEVVKTTEDLGLTLSVTKTAFLCYRPNGTPSRPVANAPKIGNIPLQHVTTQRYFGVLIDNYVTWRPEAKRLLIQCRQLMGVLRCFRRRNSGLSPQGLLALYRGLILSRILYAVPLLHFGRPQIQQLEQFHRCALRLCLGLPRFSGNVATLVEARENPISLHKRKRAMRHLVRLQDASSATSILSKLRSRPLSCLGTVTIELEDQIGPPKRRFPPTPPHTTLPPLNVTGTLPFFQRKSSVAPIVASTSTAAFLIPSMVVQQAGRLNFHTTSTTAELVAICKALEALLVLEPRAAVILTDSRKYFIPRLSEAKRLVHLITRMGHPHDGVASGNAPPPLPESKLSRKESSLLHRLRAGCPFTAKTLHKISRKNSPNCNSCGTLEDTEHVLWSCPKYGSARTVLHTALQTSSTSVTTPHQLMFPNGGKRLTEHTFRALLEFLKATSFDALIGHEEQPNAEAALATNHVSALTCQFDDEAIECPPRRRNAVSRQNAELKFRELSRWTRGRPTWTIDARAASDNDWSWAKSASLRQHVNSRGDKRRRPKASPSLAQRSPRQVHGRHVPYIAEVVIEAASTRPLDAERASRRASRVPCHGFRNSELTAGRDSRGKRTCQISAAALISSVRLGHTTRTRPEEPEETRHARRDRNPGRAEGKETRHASGLERRQREGGASVDMADAAGNGRLSAALDHEGEPHLSLLSEDTARGHGITTSYMRRLSFDPILCVVQQTEISQTILGQNGKTDLGGVKQRNLPRVAQQQQQIFWLGFDLDEHRTGVRSCITTAWCTLKTPG
ncbi:hypothetical protein HPB47_022129 [Ixodes persulcatus]|uniref:Uncharacterized protein n=1 Tax=Ixodes persulcatus TaxID=34615 RepID=A0AC60QB93_IXOPE|nr:hypothetical protein HPB47_022129 [Ixodes persulcatus]